MRKLLLIIPLLFLLAACSVKKQIVEVPVPVETVRTEYIHDTKIDSVFVRDSIDRWMKGDTFYIYKEHTKYKYLFKTDTLVKVDSIPKIIRIQTTKEVKVNYITWYQKTLMWIGAIISLLVIAYIICKLKKWI